MHNDIKLISQAKHGSYIVWSFMHFCINLRNEKSFKNAWEWQGWAEWALDAVGRFYSEF